MPSSPGPDALRTLVKRSARRIEAALDRDARRRPAPILVLGSGQRCGSTLVQRLLSSHPGVLIWGEHGGHLRDVLRASETMRAWNEGLAGQARDEFHRAGHQGWIANLLPPAETVDDAVRAYCAALFRVPAADLRRRTWGFKEVRFGVDDAELVRRFFPETRVVHITRDPTRVLSSLEWWERTKPNWTRDYTGIAIRDWARISDDFLAGSADRPWVESWRYEDVVAEPQRFTAAVAELTGLDAARFDFSVFDRRVSEYPKGRDDDGAPLPFARLPSEVRSLLDQADVQAAAAAYGYSLSG